MIMQAHARDLVQIIAPPAVVEVSRDAIEEFLLARCSVRRAEVVGVYRRRAEIIEEMAFIVETDDFPLVVSKLERYGGRTPLLSSSKDTALFALSSGIQLRIKLASRPY